MCEYMFTVKGVTETQEHSKKPRCSQLIPGIKSVSDQKNMFGLNNKKYIS